MNHALSASLIMGIVGAGHLAHAGKPATPFTFEGPTLSQAECPGNCQVATYPAGDTIATKRYVRSPSGRVAFHFHLKSTGGVTWPGSSPVPPDGIFSPFDLYNYSVTVTAIGPNGVKATNTVKAALHGTSEGDITVPLNVDWAESTIELSMVMDQQLCPKRQLVVKTHEIMPLCKFQHTITAGPDLGKIDLGAGVPQEFPKEAFIMLVTPAAAFQAPVVPVGIVYAPLGNAGKASYTITETTARNQGFTTSSGQVVAYTDDDKTGYNIGLQIGGDAKIAKAQGTFKFSGSWDNSTEDDTGDTYGTTGSIITQRQIATSYSAPPAKDPLDQIKYDTQPFWQDMILASVNAQYALWDYPAGPVIQPLANASVVVLPIAQLDSCASDTGAHKAKSLTPDHWKANTAYAEGALLVTDDDEHLLVASKGGTSGAKRPDWPADNGGTKTDGTVTWTNAQDHFVVYAGSVKEGKTKYLWLAAPDCKNLASLDKFYVAKSQSGHPTSYRLISGGSSVQTASPTTYTNTDQTTKMIGTTTTTTTTTKVSSAAVNSQDADFGVGLLSMIGIDYDSTDSSQTTLVTTSTDSVTLQKQKTLTGAGAASTTIQDSSGRAVPVNIVQDTVFEGIAVQDTNMHFKAASKRDAAPLAVPPADAKLAAVAREAAAAVPAGQSYVQHTGAGYAIVKLPTEAETKDAVAAIKAAHAAALKRHVTRKIPKP